jgi:hypothetical protein
MGKVPESRAYEHPTPFGQQARASTAGGTLGCAGLASFDARIQQPQHSILEQRNGAMRDSTARFSRCDTHSCHDGRRLPGANGVASILIGDGRTLCIPWQMKTSTHKPMLIEDVGTTLHHVVAESE